ncbi:Potassium voltage-gated channel protein Shaker [Orchesella cincta]|uniref:Potassium voltage-gated channel protein Shaker n=1 Tax=Orchesella cincta TaxID=48709 RepID=A0A1D2MRG7_ORCCI|nr:Potassium voltage-gated channel protein Shaker [Orchesella cincta]
MGTAGVKMAEPEPDSTEPAKSERKSEDKDSPVSPSSPTEPKSILVPPADNQNELQPTLPAKKRRSTKFGGKKKKLSDTVKTWNNENIITAITRACKALPFYLWTFFIDALLIPHYRPEWGRYVTWDYQTANELRRKKRYKDEAKEKSLKLRKKYKMRKMGNKIPKPVPHNHEDCLTVRINVSGQIFEPQLRTLKKFPTTLLGDPKRMIQYYDPDRDEFFFDRHRTCFESIMYYYQTGGMIRRPHVVHLEVFIEEVKFFELGPRIVATLESNEGFCVDEEKLLPKNLLLRKLWLLFEYPESSYQARVFAYCSILVVCLSVFEFCLGTMPSFQKSIDTSNKNGATLAGISYDEVFFDTLDPFLFTETICIIFFVFEFAMRALTCPQLFPFFKDLTNIIDLVAIMPYFLDLLYKIPESSSSSATPGKATSSKRGSSLTILRIIRLVRVFRILKLSRHNRGLKILGKTLKASFRELGLLVFFLFIGVIVFSSLIYFAETYAENSHFTSIPAGFWFSVVTMTTLGYGDLVPKESYGKIVGSLCAIAGVLTISLPVPVIVSNFNMFYSREETKSATEPQHFHVAQCPFYPAWYSKEGVPIGERTTSAAKESAIQMWLFGENKVDRSDSEFEELKSTDIDISSYRAPKKRARSKHTRFQRASSRQSRK